MGFRYWTGRFRNGLAWVLCGCFFMMIPLQFATMDWVHTEKGTWMILPGQPDTPFLLLMYFFYSVTSFFGVILFLLLGFLTRFERERRAGQSAISAMDIAYFTAWIEVSSLISSVSVSLWPVSWQQHLNELLFPYLPFVFMLMGTCLLFRGWYAEIGLTRPHPGFWRTMPLVLAGIYLLVFFVMDQWITEPVAHFFSLELSSWREDSISQGIHHAGQMGWYGLALQWGMVGLIGPLAEEIFFRGLLQSCIGKAIGAWGGLFLSAGIFALFHLDVTLFVPLFLLGLILGGLRQWTGQLWAPILFHILNNTVSVMFDYFTHA
ncbi:CPBP family intramembrane metalloprotease [Thermoactinomyces sp. CICC 10523]|nr:CPBP family intramembrane metalloprotease [Thermoactinomyces sp. CICC 10523]